MMATAQPIRSKVSVMICTYTEERWQDIVEAVESLQRQTHRPDEVILVVDYNPALFALMRDAFPDVVVVENLFEKGLTGGRNTGFSVAKGDVIGILDDDATADPEWVERLVRLCEQPNVMGAGGKVEPLWIGEPPAWFPPEFLWTVGCSYTGMPNTISPIRNPFGGCMFLRRELFEQGLSFRHDMGRKGGLPLSCEETEFCIRAAQQNPDKKFMYDPQATIQHKIPSKRANWRYFRIRCYAEGLSKAKVASLSSDSRNLSTEKGYVIKTLPKGVWHGLRDTLTKVKPDGFLRAVAIVFGLLVTTYGYVEGRIYFRNSASIVVTLFFLNLSLFCLFGGEVI